MASRQCQCQCQWLTPVNSSDLIGSSFSAELVCSRSAQHTAQIGAKHVSRGALGQPWVRLSKPESQLPGIINSGQFRQNLAQSRTQCHVNPVELEQGQPQVRLPFEANPVSSHNLTRQPGAIGAAAALEQGDHFLSLIHISEPTRQA